MQLVVGPRGLAPPRGVPHHLLLMSSSSRALSKVLQLKTSYCCAQTKSVLLAAVNKHSWSRFTAGSGQLAPFSVLKTCHESLLPQEQGVGVPAAMVLPARLPAKPRHHPLAPLLASPEPRIMGLPGGPPLKPRDHFS